MAAHALDMHPAPLAFTGERMVPHASDIATELFHWQRYLFFRPWYEGRKVVDAASGEGYGSSYAANFAKSVIGIDIAGEAVAHARTRYPRAAFETADVCAFDYSDADLVLSFETIEHLRDPQAFLTALSACKGEIVISTPNRNCHSPGNGLGDQPLNSFHTVEWTPSEFNALIEEHFEGRTIRFLSQQGQWPGTIREGLDEQAHYTIAVIGDRPLPTWPKLGIVVPTFNGAARCRDLVVQMTRYYPGELEFAIVNNGSDEGQTAALKQLQRDFPHQVNLVHLVRNVGYGMGANAGLDYLANKGGFGALCVSNDDVTPAIDCLSEMVCALTELQAAGHNVGAIGPVTNYISGAQQVEIGQYTNYGEMIDCALEWQAGHHSVGTQVLQLRGLFLLLNPACLEAIGGFDPRFGIGNFEDDDHNLRCRLAGFSLWIAEGAYLHHAGSSTFSELKVDYEANIQRNLQLFCEKWQLNDIGESLTLERANADLHVPYDASIEPSGYAITLQGEVVDLVVQASDVEFAAYVHNRLQGKPRAVRLELIKLIEAAA